MSPDNYPDIVLINELRSRICNTVTGKHMYNVYSGELEKLVWDIEVQARDSINAEEVA